MRDPAESHTTVAEERKLVTVLFADIVGSSQFGRDRDPEIVRASLARAFADVRSVVIEHGGTLEKFIGDAVMAIFGAPLAYDDHAERAVRASWAVRDAIARAAASSPLALAVRIGVSSGEVITGPPEEGHHIVTGHVVNVAARLQTAAMPGEILVGPLTRRLAPAMVVYGEERLVAGKGVGDVAAAPVLGLVGSGVLASLSGSSTPFVGRDDLLSQLRVAGENCLRARAPKIVVIVGPPGQGKTRLFAEFARGLADIWRIRCLPYGSGRAYAPLHELLREDLGIRDACDVATAARAIGARIPAIASDKSGLGDAAVVTLANFVSGSAEPASSDDLRWAMQRYFECRAESSLVVLVVEDAHWADPALLAMLEHLGSAVRAPLLIACLARPELRRDHPDWPDRRDQLVIELAPLSVEDSRRLAVNLLPATTFLRPAEEVAALSEGNPLYIEELTHLLRDSGALNEESAAAVLLRDVPPNLQGIIAARLDRSGESAKAVCQHAAVIGTSFKHGHLAALYRGAIEAGVAAAIDREILAGAPEAPADAGETRFRHVLIRDVAYRSLPKAQRSALHDRYSRWLEEVQPSTTDTHDLLGFHAEQAHALARELEMPCAVLGDRGASALLRSAQDRSRGDTRATLAFYERAQIVAHSAHLADEDRREIGASIAMLRYDVFGGAAEVRALDGAISAARAHGARPGLVRLLDLRAWIEVQSGSIEAARRLYEEALELARLVRDPTLVTDALLAPGEILMFTGDFSGRAASLNEALDVAEAHGLDQQRASTMRALSFLDFQAGAYTASTIRSLAADKLDPPLDPAQRATAAEDACYRAHITGRFARAVELGHEATAIADEIGSRTIKGRCYRVLAEALYSSGLHDEAQTACETAISAFNVSMAGHLCEVEATLALVCVARGDLVGARRAITLSRGHVVRHDIHGNATSLAAEAAVLAAEGSLEAADRIFRQSLSIIAQSGFGNATMETRRAYAEFLLTCGRDEEARRTLQPAIEFFSDPLAAAMRDRLIAMTQRSDQPVNAVRGKGMHDAKTL